MTVRFAVGVKVATEPAQLTLPATGVAPGATAIFLTRSAGASVPGPVTINVVPGDARVEQFIASLNVALSTWPMGTPVAEFSGMVVMTNGGGVTVVNVHT